MRPFFVRSLILTLLAACALTAPHPAAAQQPLAEYTLIGNALFCAQDLAELDKLAKLSDAQKQAAESLMKAACARARREQSNLVRKFTEQTETIQQGAYDSGEAYAEKYKTYMADYQRAALATNKVIAGIEREALSDLMAVLEKPQRETSWPGFERWRRRLLVDPYGSSFGLGLNPRLIVRVLKLCPADSAAIEEALSRYDLELDPLLIRRMEVLAKLNAEAEPTGEYDTTLWTHPELGTAQILRLNVKTAGVIQRLLSEEGQRAFLRQRICMELNGVFSRPSNDPRIKQIMQCPSLTPEQKSRFEELVVDADDAVFAMALAELRERDAAAMREDQGPAQQSEQARRQQKGSKTTTSLAKTLRDSLTIPQQEELDTAAWGNPTRDIWKMERIPVAESEWTSKPAEPEKKDTKKRKP